MDDDVLTVGDTRRTFTVAKNYSDVGVFTLFKGMHVSTFALDIPSDGKITATFTMMGLDYADGDSNTVSTVNPATTTPFMSNINVGTVLVDGESLEGVACVSAMSINLDNSLQLSAASVPASSALALTSPPKPPLPAA